MWAEESIMYQIYTLGFCGAPFGNPLEPKAETDPGSSAVYGGQNTEEGETSLCGQQDLHRIRKVIDWIPHLKKLGVTAVLFNPLFESDSHGYDTRDFRKLDNRLGTDEDLREVVQDPSCRGSVWCWTLSSITWGEDSGHFQDVLEKRWDPLTKTGSASISAGTRLITTASGMRAGKATMSW